MNITNRMTEILMALAMAGLIALAAAMAHAELVCGVHDGDTFSLCRPQTACLIKGHPPGAFQRIRLEGIDAPELRQSFGPQARDYLAALVRNREIKLTCHGCSYDRQVCHATATINSQPFNLHWEMVARGWAFDAPKYSGGRYAVPESQARTQQRGVWQQPNGGTRPWDVRHPR